MADLKRDDTIIAAMREYDGPVNRVASHGCARCGNTSRITTWAVFTRAERNELWAKI